MIVLKLIRVILLFVVSSVSYATGSKGIPILGHNGQTVEFSGISYATKEGIHARLQNGSEMQVSWSLIDKSIFREQGGALQEPYIFLQASDIVYLAWGFYSSPHFDESLLNFKSKVIQCATDQFAIIASEDYSKYGVAFVCVTKGISISKAVLIDPFAAPPPNDSGFESRVLQKELDTLGITGKPAVEIDLGHFKLHVFFREHLRSIIGYDPNQSPLFDLTTLTYGSVNPFNPFAAPKTKNTFRSDIRLISHLVRLHYDYTDGPTVRESEYQVSKHVRDTIYAFAAFLKEKGIEATKLSNSSEYVKEPRF